MVKIRDTTSFWLGLFYVFIVSWAIIVLDLPPSEITLPFFVIFLLEGIYLIFSNILERGQAMLSISIGIVALISVFIWLTALNADLLSKDVIISISGALFFFIYGIVIHLGLLPEKYI